MGLFTAFSADPICPKQTLPMIKFISSQHIIFNIFEKISIVLFLIFKVTWLIGDLLVFDSKHLQNFNYIFYYEIIEITLMRPLKHTLIKSCLNSTQIFWHSDICKLYNKYVC